MSLSMKHQFKSKRLYYFFALSLVLIIGLLFAPSEKVTANDKEIYSDGIYRYMITNEVDKEVQLIGVETTEEMEELYIPGKVTIDEKEYVVASVYFNWNYYENEKYAKFFNSVKKLNVADTFTGTLDEPTYAFLNLTTIEFQGKSVPKEIKVSLSNRAIKDIVFIVPKGKEVAYSRVIRMYINYYVSSDLYEQEIEITPTVVSKDVTDIEYGYFAVDGFIYKVIDYAKDGVGKVQLVGITHPLKRSYIALPETVRNNGYRYQLTSLARFSLIGCGARVIVVPDSVTEMESSVFDRRVELLFLSQNCKVIPRSLITDENNETNLRFVHVPEGVTTISDYAFNDIPSNTASIILPTTIKKVGKESLSTFKLVTFLNKKPLDKVASAIKKGTTVKVNKSAISTFKKVLGNKASVVEAKNIVKTKSLTVNKENIKINTINTATITAKLTKGSNETIYWLSTDPELIEISSKGVITPKKDGIAYVVAYTRTSGKHKAIKITITETTFEEGIFSYRITNPAKKTVSLCQVRPTKNLKVLNIPETVKYKKVKYTVTGVIANPEDTSIPLIPDDFVSNKIKEITFPKTISGTVGYLGKLKHINSITFKGKNAPDAICDWYLDDGLLAWQTVICVPKGSVNSYTTALWMRYGNNTYAGKHYGCSMDFNIVESGNKQVQRFVVDGIVYRVTKYAGKKNGEVAVKGVDINLKKINIKKTVTYNGYTYKVTEIYKGALKNSDGKEISIDKSIKKRNTEERFRAPVYYVL